jgi:hypothetical protein
VTEPVVAPIDDSDLPPFAVLVGGFAPDMEGDDDAIADIEQVILDLTIECHVRPEGHVVASTPTQYIATSVMPVFDRLRLRLERDVDA